MNAQPARHLSSVMHLWLFGWLVLLGVTLVWYAFPLLPAQAVVAAPTEFGSIAGVVRDTSGRPLAGMTVGLYTTNSLPDRSTTTDATGTYQLSLLLTNSYLVQVSDPTNIYLSQLYSTSVSVSGQPVTGIDFALHRSARIIGKVTVKGEKPAITPHQTLVVTAYTQQYDAWQQVAETAVVTQTGIYTLTGLASNVYQVCALLWLPAGHFVKSCYGQNATQPASDLTLNEAATLTDINIDIESIGYVAGTLRGTVTAAGKPLTGTKVQVYNLSFSDFYPVDFVNTDQAGAYQFPFLETGNYYVQVIDSTGVYPSQFYKDNYRLQVATPVSVNSNAVTELNLVLRPGATVTGKVTVWGNAGGVGLYSVPEVLIYHQSNPITWDPVVITPVVTATGLYTVQHILPGIYQICAQTQVSGIYSTNCHGGPAPVQGKIFTLTDGVALTAINIDLKPDGIAPSELGSISGLVHDGQNSPLAGMNVALYSLVTGYVTQVTTNNAGAYQFSQLVSGAYYVQVSDQTNLKRYQYYPTGYNVQTATSIQVKGQPVSGIDFNFQSDATITGHIIIPSKIALGPQYTPQVTLYAQLQSGDWSPITTTLATPTGVYTLSHLLRDIYRVCVVLQEPLGCYGGDTPSQSSDIDLTTDATRTNIDINLDNGQFDGAIQGTVTADGKPLPQITALLFNPDAQSDFDFALIVSAETSATGQYSIGGLPAGRYKVAFADPNLVYAEQWHTQEPILIDDRSGGEASALSVSDQPGVSIQPASIARATQPQAGVIHRGYLVQPSQFITVSRGQIISNVNVSMVRYGIVQGKLSLGNGLPLTNTTVAVTVGLVKTTTGSEASVQSVRFITIDANGNYTLNSLYPGTYTLSFEYCVASVCHSVNYQKIGGLSPGESPRLLAVPAAATLTGIDMVLGQRPLLFLPFIKASGAAIMTSQQ